MVSAYFLVVSQPYAANVMDDFVISGNNQIIKCNIPAIVSESVLVTSWFINETPVERNENFGRCSIWISRSGIAGTGSHSELICLKHIGKHLKHSN